jgi:RNA polymerase sigma-70 factor (ECF subfamily)
MNQLEHFNQYRPLLFSIAYRMLGSAMDAEDMIQETYLRWQQQDETEIESPKAFLSTVITRLCIDHLRSARVQREQYLGPWLPEPLISSQVPDAAEMAALADSLSTAFLVLLESLSPTERAVFLLREVFDYDYADIARIVGKSEANCRQIVHRAGQHISARRPRFDTSPEQQEQLTLQFLETCTTGDMDGFMNLLTEDIVLRSDGGGKVAAATRPVYGPNRVARFFFGLIRKATPGITLARTPINHQPGLITYYHGRPVNVITFDFAGDRIRRVFIVVNPDKLHGLPPLGGGTSLN